MNRFVAVAAGIIALTACATPASRRQAQYEQRREALVYEYYHETFLLDCSKNGIYPFTSQCTGLITAPADQEMLTLLKKLSRSKSKKSTKAILSDAATLKESVAAQLALKYKFADWDHVNLECKAKPADCKTFGGYEILALFSHDHKVMEATRAAIRQYDLGYAEEIQRNMAADPNYNSNAASLILKGMGQGLQNASRNQTHCTTTGSPGFYTTNCY